MSAQAFDSSSASTLSRSAVSVADVGRGVPSPTRTSALSRLPRLTMPTILPPSTTGTRLIRCCSSNDETSPKGVSGFTVTTRRVITSPALRACDLMKSCAIRSRSANSSSHQERRRSVSFSTRWMRSPSLTMPTRAPAASTTGTPLMPFASNISAISLTVVSAWTVTTSWVMTSAANMAPPPFELEKYDHKSAAIALMYVKPVGRGPATGGWPPEGISRSASKSG